jgi:hypothetical protein
MARPWPWLSVAPSLLTMNQGHYEVQQWDEHTRSFREDLAVGLFITVDEVFDNDHRIVSQRGERKGRFTFSAADSGEHKICFSPTNSVAHSGYLTNGEEVGGIKLTLDMAVGETSNIESTDKEKIDDIVSKVRDLNGRLQDIRREQVFQRVRLHSLQLPIVSMLTISRNAKPSSATSLNPPILASSGGQ